MAVFHIPQGAKGVDYTLIQSIPPPGVKPGGGIIIYLFSFARVFSMKRSFRMMQR